MNRQHGQYLIGHRTEIGKAIPSFHVRKKKGWWTNTIFSTIRPHTTINYSSFKPEEHPKHARPPTRRGHCTMKLTARVFVDGLKKNLQENLANPGSVKLHFSIVPLLQNVLKSPPLAHECSVLLAKIFELFTLPDHGHEFLDTVVDRDCR